MCCSRKKNYADLEQTITQMFPLDKTDKFQFYPFSNDSNWLPILETLTSSKPLPYPSKMAILVGESHLLSILPELAKHADIVLLVDIQARLHLHTQHLLACLDKTNDREHFIALYSQNNPIVTESGNLSLENLLLKLKRTSHALQKHSFLHSDKRFNQCKAAYKKLHFTQIQLDLMSANDTLFLSKTLAEHHTKISFCNLTNIQDYDGAKQLPNSISQLLKDSQDALIAYSSTYAMAGSLRASLAKGLNSYKSDALNSLSLVSASSNTYPTLFSNQNGTDQIQTVMSSTEVTPKQNQMA